MRRVLRLSLEIPSSLALQQAAAACGSQFRGSRETFPVARLAPLPIPRRVFGAGGIKPGPQPNRLNRPPHAEQQ